MEPTKEEIVSADEIVNGLHGLLFAAYLTGQSQVRTFKSWYDENQKETSLKDYLESYASLKVEEERRKQPFLGWTTDKDILNQQREYWGAMNGVKELQSRIAELEKALEDNNSCYQESENRPCIR